MIDVCKKESGIMYISVVEDNPAVLAMIETALSLYGHIVETYSTSISFLSALQRAERSPAYDLVIVDLFLGRQLGTHIIEALWDTQSRVIPAILISAAEESAFEPIRKRYPDVPILQKPFKIQTLVSLIRETTIIEEIACRHVSG
jgi:CheY-like chemotaxis protein